MVSPSLNFILKYDMLRKVHSELSQNDCMGETHAKTLTEKQKTHRIDLLYNIDCTANKTVSYTWKLV